MNILDILLLSVALAMDCFTVSIVSGVIISKVRGARYEVRSARYEVRGAREWPTILRLSVLFGLFQAMMPFLGWLATSHFASYIEDYDHWIAFSLLTFLGGRMIRDAFQPEEKKMFNPRQLRTQLMLAVATSIDAMAIGIPLAMTGYNDIASLIEPLAWIGIVSFLFGIIGHLLGIYFGNSVRQRLRPELLGGIILLMIGVKILLTHLA